MAMCGERLLLAAFYVLNRFKGSRTLRTNNPIFTGERTADGQDSQNAKRY